MTRILAAVALLLCAAGLAAYATTHTDHIDCYGERWIWCDGCEGFRLDGHKVHKSNYGWSAVAELDGCYGPLTYPPGECDRG